MDRRKEAVLTFLKASGPTGLAEVAAHLEVSKQGALRHLDALQAAGLVEHVSGSHERPGRPGHVYRLTPAAAEHFPHSHRELAGELISFMSPSDVDRFFAERAARLEAAYAAELDGLGFEDRVRRLAELASGAGHMSEFVDNGDGTFAIRHHNCPIADVAAATGHPCRREQSMYERLLGAEATRTSWLGNADNECTYVVRGSKS